MAHDDHGAADNGPDFAQDYAAFAAGLDPLCLPPEVIAAAKANVLDTLACAAAGYSATGVRDLAGLVAGWGGRADAAIWFDGIAVPAHHAALVNGMMAHARDYDDTHDEAVLHAGVSVVPAALAAAQLCGASGADMIAGVVAGLELICRLGLATTIGITQSGYMYTSLFGHFAATAAAARVLRLDSATTANALGIAYSQAAGNHQVTRDAALTKRLQPGFAAKTGLLSVALAQIGITGTYRTFEGVDGLFHAYLKGNYDPARLRAGLGERFRLTELSYKPFPCCRLNHTAIEAALRLRGELAGDVDSIAAIRCGVNTLAFQAVGTPIAMRRAPTTVVEAQFSLPYTIACSLVKGRVGLAEFGVAALADPAVLRLAAKVEPYVDDRIESGWGRSVSPARLTIETGSGETGSGETGSGETGVGRHEVFVDVPLGHPDRPMSAADSAMKLADCLAISGLDFADDAAERLQATVAGLDRLPDVAALFDLLKPKA